PRSIPYQGRDAPGTAAFFWAFDTLKKPIFREYTTSQSNRCRSCRSRGSNQSPNELLKFDAGSELRSVGRNFIGITAVIVVVIKIAEAEFGIDAPGNMAAERRVGLHGDGGIDVKAADIHFAGHVESLAQLISTANADVGISPILGETVTAIELCL